MKIRGIIVALAIAGFAGTSSAHDTGLRFNTWGECITTLADFNRADFKQDRASADGSRGKSIMRDLHAHYQCDWRDGRWAIVTDL